MEFISGEDRHQGIMLPDTVDDYVGGNSAVRVIDAYINSLNPCELGFAKPQPNETGRPMYDPKDLLKLYVYGYMNRIRSSRRLEAESKRNLEVIWLLGKLTPDHKTIARFRHDNGKALKNVFLDFVGLCVKLDLYGKELVAIDGSKFKAVNSKSRNFTKDKLKDRLKRIDEKIDEYLSELERADSEEETSGEEKSPEEIKRIIRGLGERRKLYQSYADEMERDGETQKSLTDEDSRLMMANGKMDVCYNVQTAVDAKNRLVVGFEVTNNVGDINQITPMAEQVKEALGVERIAVVADKGYDSAADIAAAIRIGVDPHVAGTDYDICVPVEGGVSAGITAQKAGRCAYVAERNIALCPMGKTLYPRYYKKSGGKAVFHNNQVCKQCACRCTTMGKGYRYYISMPESDFTKEYNEKDVYARQVHVKPKKELYEKRKTIVEHPFGTIKRAMDGGYCLTKGKRNVRGEFSLAFLAYNIKRVINVMGSRKLIECMA